MELRHRIILHLPEKKFVDGRLEDITIGRTSVSDTFEERLQNIGADGYYTQKATGHYKFRSYPETIFTLYCGDEDDVGKIIKVFEDLFTEHREEVQQEAIAYEIGDRLYIKDI